MFPLSGSGGLFSCRSTRGALWLSRPGARSSGLTVECAPSLLPGNQAPIRPKRVGAFLLPLAPPREASPSLPGGRYPLTPPTPPGDTRPAGHRLARLYRRRYGLAGGQSVRSEGLGHGVRQEGRHRGGIARLAASSAQPFRTGGAIRTNHDHGTPSERV